MLLLLKYFAKSFIFYYLKKKLIDEYITMPFFLSILGLVCVLLFLRSCHQLVILT